MYSLASKKVSSKIRFIIIQYGKPQTRLADLLRHRSREL
jgi:hypothetical protein